MVSRVLAALGMIASTATASFAADLRGVELPLPPESNVPSFYIHFGPAGLIYDTSARIKAYNVLLPGASATVDDAATVAVEAGYYITPNIAASFTGGFPPLAKVTAAGTLNGLGTVGKAQGGPISFTVHYHFDGLGPFQPYIGGGLAALVVLEDKDGLLTRLNTRNAVGPAVQGGFDYMIDDRWGWFFDVKKAFLTAHASGYLGPTYVRTRLTLDPVVLHSGVSYRF